MHKVEVNEVPAVMLKLAISSRDIDSISLLLIRSDLIQLRHFWYYSNNNYSTVHHTESLNQRCSYDVTSLHAHNNEGVTQ